MTVKPTSFFRHYRLSLALLFILVGSLLGNNPTVLALISGHAVGGGPQSNAGFAVRQPAALNNGLTAYYPLDGNANDTSGNGNTGTLSGFTYNGTTNGWSKGKFGNALLFSGAATSVSLPATAMPSSAGAFSVSLWINTAAGLNSTSQTVFLYNENYGAQTGWALLDDGPYNPYVEFRLNGHSTPLFTDNAAVARSTINDNSWHLVTGVYTGSQVLLYIDGTIRDTRSADTFVPYPTAASMGNTTSGMTDDVRIYSRALSAPEITTLYQGSSPENCDQYCMGWWKLDGASGTTEDSQYAYDYGPHGTVAGYYGNALKFTGGDFGSSSKTTTNPTTFSYSAWFKTTTSGAIISFTNNTNGRNLFVGDDGKVYYQNIAFGGTGSELISTSTYNDNAWHHVALSLTGGSTGTLYVDGSQVATSSSLGTPTTATGSWYVGEGNFYLGLNKTYNMTLDDMRVYNVALIASDVTTLYGAGSPSACTTLCYAYWPLDDTSGSTGADSSGNSNTLGLSSNITGATFSFPYSVTNRSINRATLSGTTFGTNSTGGIFGSAITLNGTTSYIYAAGILDNSTAAELTEELWFKTSSNVVQTILKNSNGTDYRVVNITATGQINTHSGITSSTSGYNDGNWHHLAVTFSNAGSATQVYVDGILVGSKSGYEIIGAHSFFYVGQNWSSNAHFSGSIDDIREYSRVLSSYEIYEQYIAGR